MKQKFTVIGTLILFICMTTIFGFKYKSDFGQTKPGNSVNSANISEGDKTENVTTVSPNPESGVINLRCCPDLKSPVTIKAINDKDTTVKMINSLNTEGINNNKFIRLNTSKLHKGEYTVIMYDAIGKTFTRRIFLNK